MSMTLAEFSRKFRIVPTSLFGLPRHAVLWVKGRGWIDSTNREWRATPAPHKRAWPVGAPALVGLAVAAKAWGLW